MYEVYQCKKTIKVLVRLTAGILFITSAATLTASTNQVYAVESADTNSKTKDGLLTLNHKTRIYNNKGQKRYSYLGSNGLLKNGAEVKYVGTVKAIASPEDKRYSFPDNDWNWFYLPYKIIKGEEYYNIGHGGYIKAVNVQKINGNWIYTNQVVTTTKAWSSSTNVPVYDSNGSKTSKTLKIGQKVTLDRQANIFDLTEKGDGYNGGTNFYRIKGTNEFINCYQVEKIKHTLPTYTNYADVLFINDGYLYNAKGEKVAEKNNKPRYSKGSSITVTSQINITDKSTGKSEPFYRLANKYIDLDHRKNNECYIKASDTKIMWGRVNEATKQEDRQ